jgi:3-methyladenine DNA glycosylase AlkD
MMAAEKSMPALTSTPAVASILAQLKSKGSEKTRAIYARHGMAPERVLGVSVADLKVIAKTIKGQQALACELYATGIMDAMYLAGLVASGSKMSRDELQQWAEGAAGLPMISEYTVPWVAVESRHAREVALVWISSGSEYAASSGWATYAGIVTTTPDEDLDLGEIEGLLDGTVKHIHTAPNRVRHAMNHFIITVGSYVRPLTQKAKSAARKIGEVTVDKGDTACKEAMAEAYIEKMEASGRAGTKRKTIRC